jgi:putative membrane protein
MAEASVMIDRQRIEGVFDDIVRENRDLFALVFPIAGAVVLIASAESVLPTVVSFNPFFILIGVIGMRLPLIAGLLPRIDRTAATALIALTAYAYTIEYVGTTTGIPYGQFSYGIALGPMLFGKIPLALPIFFVPLVVNSYLLCLLLLDDHADRAIVRRPVVVTAVLGMDLVLDPAAVALGFWTYGGGLYYDVPLSNFVGWIVSAAIAVTIFDWGFERTTLFERLQQCEFMLDSLVSFVVFWGIVNAYFGNLVPLAIAGLFGLGLVKADRIDYTVREVGPNLGR